MQTGQISHDHPLDEVYRKKYQDAKMAKMMSGASTGFKGSASIGYRAPGQQLMGTDLNNNSFLGQHHKAEDPLIKAETEKKVREQRKILEQDYIRSLEEIDKNFELRK